MSKDDEERGADSGVQRVLAWDDIIYELQDLLANEEQPVYLVGGTVRDAFMRRPLKDVDMATPQSGVKLARKIANLLKGDFYALDAERDVGRVLYESARGKIIIDVARFRANNLNSDLLDRDFTINAMAVDIRGDLTALIDPLGGERDLSQKILRRCSPLSIQHDPIRALRGVRQSVAFNLRIEPETLKDMRASADSLAAVSPERLRDEFYALLNLSKGVSALRIADTLGLLKVIVPELDLLRATAADSAAGNNALAHTLATIDQLSQLLATVSFRRTDETAAQFTLGTVVMTFDRYRRQLVDHFESTWANDRPHRALLLLAALLHETGVETIDSWGIRMRLSSAEIDRLLTIARHHHRFMEKPFVNAQDTPDLRGIHRYWRDTREAGIDILFIALASYLAEKGAALDQDAWLRVIQNGEVLLRAWFDQHDTVINPPPLVDGRSLMKSLAIPAGRTVGLLLELIREGQAAGEIITVEDALNFARAYLAGNQFSQNGLSGGH